jgi:hypothetical protein
VIILGCRSCIAVVFRSALYDGRWSYYATKGIRQSRPRGNARCLGGYIIVFKWCRVTGRHIIGDLDFNKNPKSVLLTFR